MYQASAKVATDLDSGILAPLSFFSLYGLPLSKEQIFNLIYKVSATREQINQRLEYLVSAGRVQKTDNLYSLKPWKRERMAVNRLEMEKRWQKIARYSAILRAIPYIEHISVIHSLAIGNVDQESDIDFFVVTKPNRLYFVRTMIIILFKLFGVYKTRKKIKEQFCFGYYLTTENLNLAELEGQDNFLAFWFAAHIPVLGPDTHADLIRSNTWIYEYFPNFQGEARNRYFASSIVLTSIKKLLEMLLFLPTIVAEPILRKIHITHTFNLPENHWPTSLTVANKNMLKLQALSQRRQINQAFEAVLQSLR